MRPIKIAYRALPAFVAAAVVLFAARPAAAYPDDRVHFQPAASVGWSSASSVYAGGGALLLQQFRPGRNWHAGVVAQLGLGGGGGGLEGGLCWGDAAVECQMGFALHVKTLLAAGFSLLPDGAHLGADLSLHFGFFYVAGGAYRTIADGSLHPTVAAGFGWP